MNPCKARSSHNNNSRLTKEHLLRDESTRFEGSSKFISANNTLRGGHTNNNGSGSRTSSVSSISVSSPHVMAKYKMDDGDLKAGEKEIEKEKLSNQQAKKSKLKLLKEVLIVRAF